MTVASVKYQEDGKLQATINGKSYSGLHPSLGLYRDHIQPWLDAGNTPEPWETQTERLNRLVREKRAEIDSDFRGVVVQCKEGYTEDEVQSWERQIEEAKAYQLDNTSSTPLIDGILENRPNETRDSLATAILDKAATFAAKLGPAMGRKQQRHIDLDAIDLTAPDAEDQIAAV